MIDRKLGPACFAGVHWCHLSRHVFPQTTTFQWETWRTGADKMGSCTEAIDTQTGCGVKHSK